MEAYKGVPHGFAEIWELPATKRFWADIRDGITGWLRLAQGLQELRDGSFFVVV